MREEMSRGSNHLIDMIDLDQMRRLGDPITDRLVASMMARGYERRFPLDAISYAYNHGDSAAVEFMDHTSSVPEWVDWKLLERGRRLFVRTHVLSSASLLLGGMIESYTNPNIARVLAYSGRLIESSKRRLFETGQMVYDTHLPDGLRPFAQGHQTLLKIRILHAVIRAHIRTHSSSSTPSSSSIPSPHSPECPINQEDSVFTMLMFNVAVPIALSKIGVKWTLEERNAYHHFWRYAGWILGVDSRLLCVNYTDAVHLYKRIKARHCAYGQDAINLTHALIKGIHNQPPFFLPQHILYALTRTFLGDHASDQLQIPHTPKSNFLLRASTPIFSSFSYLLSHSKPLEHLSHQVGQTYGRRVIQMGLKDHPATFESTLTP